MTKQNGKRKKPPDIKVSISKKQKKCCPMCNGTDHTKPYTKKCSFRKEKSIVSEKPCKQCKHCNGTDHSRKSSNKCSEYNPRESKKKPDIVLQPDECFVSEFTSFKCGLRNILKKKELSRVINSIVESITFISFEMSRLLNLHFLMTFEQERCIPELSRNFIREAFRLVQFDNVSEVSVLPSETRTEEETRDFKDLFFTFKEHYLPIRSTGNFKTKKLGKNTSQIVTCAVKDYKTISETHITNCYWRNLRKFCKIYFQGKFEDTEKCIKFFEKGPSEEEILADYHKDFIVFLYKTQTDLYRTIFESSKWIYKHEMIWMKKKFAVTRLLLCSRKIKLNSLRLKAMDLQFVRLQKRISEPLKICTLLPLMSEQAKYIRIETDALYGLVGSKKIVGSSVEDLCKKISNFEDITFQEKMWRDTFKIRNSLFHNKVDKKKFHYQILTDGVGCSIICEKVMIVKIKPEESVVEMEIETEKIDIYKEIRETKVINYIGIDPGIGSILTSVLQKENGNESSISFSNGEYQHSCKNKQAAHYTQLQMKKLGLVQWNSGIPSPKTETSDGFKNYLKYIFKGDFLQMKFKRYTLSEIVKYKRFERYTLKQKTIHQFCTRIISEIPKNETTVIAFGNASWSKNLKGYASSCRGKVFYNYLKTRFKDHKLFVFSTSEYNTSQICSKCQKFQRIISATEKGVAKPHYVRRCKNIICHTLWNRDINASRNMITVLKSLIKTGKKPDVFSNHIPTKTENASVNDA